MSEITRNAIIESFIKLLNTTSLDKITVKDIVSGCGVNRNTFYYYFKDIYDLLSQIFEAEKKRLVGTNINYDSWRDAFMETSRFAIQNKTAIYHIYNSLSREKLESYLYHVMDNLVLTYINNQEISKKVKDDDKKFISSFYKYALVGIILEWVSGHMAQNPDDIYEKMCTLLDGNINYLLNKSIE